MKRLRELGLRAEAFEICKGLLLGLYRIRDTQDDELLGWAPDFAMETAADAAQTWAGRGDPKRTMRARWGGPGFEQEFVDEYIPEWRALIARALEGG